MARSPYAIINPDILAWARETAGIDIATAAKRVNTRIERLQSWEKGEVFPSTIQLRKIASVYQRPICIFYLLELPEEPEAIRDFRRLRGGPDERFSSALLFEIRHAHDMRETALELIVDLGQDPLEIRLRAQITDDPGEVASELRKLLGISINTQIQWSNKYDAFNSWRAAVEHLGILVFQMGGRRNLSVDVSEARGFSIAKLPLPVLGVNGKDFITARCFTLIHELAHVLLQNGGLCDLHHMQTGTSDIDRIEVFCNHVAGASLVPANALLQTDVVRKHTGGIQWNDNELYSLARRFWVSWEVILRRLLILDLTNQQFYRAWRRRGQDRYPEKIDTGTPHLTMPVRVIRRYGRLFPSLVFRAFGTGLVTAYEASASINAGPQYFPDIQSEVFYSRYAH